MSTTGPPVSAQGEDRLSRLVAVGAVVATVLAGLVAFLLVIASTRGSDAALDADRRGLEAMGSLTRSLSQVEAQYETFLLAQQEKTQAALAVQEGLFAPGSERLQHELAEDRWLELASDANPPLFDVAGPHGPELDPAFPERVYATHMEDAVRLAALQDAYNEIEGVYGQKVSEYIAIITMFGVALYLFALLSVTLQTDIKKMFAVVAAGLLVVGTLWTGLVATRNVPKLEPQAAERFAKGHVALTTAHDRPDYERAIDHYTAAIDRRDTFARAYFERAEATFLAGSAGNASTSVLSPLQALEVATDPETLSRSHEDLVQAHELGLATSPVVGQLGFHAFLQGWADDDTDALEESVELSDEAIAEDPNEPVWHYNKGLALLALRQYDEAQQAYDVAIENTLFVVGTETSEEKEEVKEPREDATLIELLEAEALTNLELLTGSGDAELERHVSAVKSRIVASVSAGRLQNPGATAHLGEVGLDVLPSEARVSFEAGAVPTLRGPKVSLQLYYDTDGRSYVIPEASRLLEPGEADQVELRFLSTTTPPRCLPDGHYRLDVYVNGNLAASAPDDADYGHLHGAAAATDLDVGACVPDDWEHSPASLPGLFHAQESHDESRTLHLFRFDVHPGNKGSDPGDFAQEAVRLASGGQPSLTGESPVTVPPWDDELRGAVGQTYRLPGQVMEARAGLDDEGAAVVAVVSGPSDYMSTSEPDDILDSVFLYEPDSRG